MKHPAKSLVLVHPPSVSKRYLPTRFPPHGMAVLYASLNGLGIPVIQVDRLMDSLYQDGDGLDVHGPDRDLSEAEYLEYLDTGQGRPRLRAFVDRHLAALPGDEAMYAFSAVSYHQLSAALLLASELSRRSPETSIILGGPCVTVKPAEFLGRFRVPHAWVKGCGMDSLARLWRGEAREHIPGLVRFAGDVPTANPHAQSFAEAEPPPDFSGLDMETYRYDHPTLGHTLFLPYRTTKGCPSACSFCSGRLVDPFTAKSPGKIVEELGGLTSRYENRSVMFTDASINAQPDTFLDVCRLLARELPGLRWYAYARVRGFTPRHAEAAAAAGCFALFFGAESAHAPTIRLLGKGFAPRELTEAIDAASDAGIKSVAHLMYNTPHESPADVDSFLELVARYEGDPLVEFMAQRFLLEADTLMFTHPGRYGLARVRPVPAGFFDRQEYAYDLADGTSWEKVREGHAAKRLTLGPVLDRLERRVFPRDPSGTRLPRELM